MLDNDRAKKQSPYFAGFMSTLLSDTLISELAEYIIIKTLVQDKQSNVHDVEAPIVLNLVKSENVSSVILFDRLSYLYDIDQLLASLPLSMGKIESKITIINKLIKDIYAIDDIDIEFTMPPHYQRSPLLNRIIEERGVSEQLAKEDINRNWNNEYSYLLSWYVRSLDFRIVVNRITYNARKAIDENKLMFITVIAGHQTQTSGHALSIIFDPKKKMIEFYDPNGVINIPEKGISQYPSYGYHFEYFKPILSSIFKEFNFKLEYFPQAFPSEIQIGAEHAASMFASDVTPIAICIWYSLKYLYDRSKEDDPIKLHKAYVTKFISANPQDAIFEIYTFAEVILGNIKIENRNFLDIAYELYLLGSSASETATTDFRARLATLSTLVWNKYKLNYSAEFSRKYIFKKLKGIITDDILDKELEFYTTDFKITS